jgi:O-antigen ligase
MTRFILRVNRFTLKPDLHISLPQISIPKKWILIGSAVMLLLAGFLAISILIGPEIAMLGLGAIFVGIPLIALLWNRPELGLLAVVFLASSLIRSDIFDLRLPVGGLELRDLALIAMLSLLSFRGLIRKELAIPWPPVAIPLIIFLAFALFSTFYAIVFRHVAANWVFSELRAVVFYSVFFVTAWAVTTSRQIKSVLVGMYIIADLIAGVVILQQFLGTNKYLLAAMSYSNWRVYAELAGGTGGLGTVRIMPPGVLLVYFMMIISFCMLVFLAQRWRRRIFLILQISFLGISLLLTYTRALWIGTAFALGVVLLAIFPIYKAKVVRYFVTAGALIFVLFSLINIFALQDIGNSALVTGLLERVGSIFTPNATMESASIQWRLFENGEAIRSISENPLLGVGLGNSYRGLTTLQGESLGWRTGGSLAADSITRFTRFIHNGYLYIAVKLGIPAFICFLWFCMAFSIIGWILFRRLAKGQYKGMVLAILAGFIGLLLWSIYHQHFMMTESTAIIGLVAGLQVSIYQISKVYNGASPAQVNHQ